MSSAAGSVRTLGHEQAVRWCAFAPNGEELAVASLDHKVYIWNLSTSECIVLVGHTDEVNYCTFSPNGQILLTVSKDGTVRLWFRPFNSQQCFIINNESAVLFCDISPDGSHFATASVDQTVKVWSLNTRECLLTLQMPEQHVLLRSCVFSPDGRKLVTSHEDGSVLVWNLNKREFQCLAKYSNASNICMVSPGGAFLATTSHHRAEVLDFHKGAPLCSLVEHTDRVQCVAFNPMGDTVATSGRDQTVRLWDSLTGIALDIFKGHTSEVSCCVFSPDGSVLVTASRDKPVKLWQKIKITLLSPRARVFVLVLIGRRTRMRLPPKLWAWLFDEFLIL